MCVNVVAVINCDLWQQSTDHSRTFRRCAGYDGDAGELEGRVVSCWDLSEMVGDVGIDARGVVMMEWNL